jgi:hypothetical protein
MLSKEQKTQVTITATNIISHEIRNLRRAYGWSVKRPPREKHKVLLEKNIIEAIELSYSVNILLDYKIQMKEDSSSLEVLFRIDFDKLDTIINMRSTTDLNIQH